MSNCQCQTCLPTCGHPSPASCPDYIVTGTAVKVVDSNCTERLLSGTGLTYSIDGVVYNTDGSARYGQIKLNPEQSGGGKGILVRTADGTLVSLGEEAPDGSVIFKIGGQWKAGSITDQTTSFAESSLRRFSTNLASFGCGPNGTLTLGIYDGCPDGFLSFDSLGAVSCKSITDIATSMLTEICNTAISIPDDEAISGILVCTENGIRKSAQTQGKTYLATPLLIYCQHRVWSGFVPSPGNEVANIPPLTPSIPGPFADQLVDVDLSTLPGYSDLAKEVMINILTKAYTDSLSSWDLVVVVNGMEYARIAMGYANSYGTDNNQVHVRIPDNKKLTIHAQRQVNNGVGGNEFAYAAIWLQAFVN